jgi:lysophospholipase L1-like esterase
MNDRLLISVYGDSLSMPRALDGIRHFEIYPELLRDAIQSSRPRIRISIHNRSSGGVSISALYEQFMQDSAYYEKQEQGILIIQCGIVDCAPRPVPPSVRTRIARLPPRLRLLVTRLLHHGRPFLLRAGLVWRNTDIDRFESVLTQWIRMSRKIYDRVYVINIAPTTPAIAAHSPGMQSSIDSYNGTIRRVVNATDSPAVMLIDVHKAIAEMDSASSPCVNEADGHHITHAGHRLYADLILGLEVPRSRGSAAAAEYRPERESD